MSTHRLRHFTLLAALAVRLCQAAGAQPVELAHHGELHGSRGIDFRRVHIPTELVDQYADDSLRRWPIRRSEFVRLLQANERIMEAERYRAPRLASITLEARLSQEGRLIGEAWLQATSTPGLSQVLELEPLSPSILDAVWVDGQAPAQLGMWSQPPKEPAFGLLVQRPGLLQIDWSSAPQTVADGKHQYRLQFPDAETRRLSIEIPATYRAKVENGRLLTTALTLNERAKRWTFQLGGGPCAIQLEADAETPAQLQSQSSVSIAETYGLTPGSLDYDAIATVYRTESTDAFEFRVVGDLHVSGVSVAGAAVDWSLEGVASRVLRVATPSSQNPLRIRIRGAARWAAESLNALPKLTPQNALWTDGTFVIRPSSTARLQAVQCRDCSIAGRSLGGSTRDRGESVTIHAASTSATVSVEIGANRSKPRGRALTAISFDRSEVVASSKIEILPTRSDHRLIEIRRRPGWTVESVDGELVEDWFLARSQEEDLLHVILKPQASDDDLKTVTVIGRAPALELASHAVVRDFDWLRPVSFAMDTRLLHFADSNAQQLVPSRELVAAMFDRGASEGLESLVAEAGAGVLIDLAKARPDLRIEFQSAASQFDAESWTELRGEGRSIVQRIEVVATVLTGALREFTLVLNEPLPPTAEWRIVGSDVAPKVSRVPNDASTRAAADTTAHYRVVLPTATSSAVRLETVAQQNVEAATAVAAFIAEATSNAGWIIVQGDPARYEVDSGGASPAAPANPSATQFPSSPILGVFRAEDRAVDGSARLPTIRRRNDSAPADQLASTHGAFRRALTWQYANGVQRHRVVYRLESNGGSKVTLTFPEPVSVESVRVAGQEIVVEKNLGNDRPLELDLPARVGPVSAVVEYSAKHRPLGAARTIRACLPQESVEFLAGSWTLYVPSRYAPLDVGVVAAQAMISGPWQQSSGTRDGVGGFLPQVAAALPSASGTPAAGWSLASQEFTLVPDDVTLVLNGVVDAIWWFVWFVVAALALMTLRQRPSWFFWGCAILCCGWLLLQTHGRYLAGAALVGAATAVQIRWLASSRRAWLGDFEKATLVFAAVAVAASSLEAVATAEESVPETPPAVLFPIDENMQPDGEDVFVPEQLLQRLWRGAAADPYDGAAYVVTGAAHTLRLTRPGPSRPVTCESLDLELRFRTFAPDVAVRFDLDRGQTPVRADSVAVDGDPAVLSWNDSADECVVQCADEGEHVLRLTALPLVRVASDGRAELAMHVPKIPTTEVFVQWPSDILEPTLNGRSIAIGSSSRGSPTSVLNVQGNIVFGWTEPSPQSPLIEGAEESLWLDLGVDETTLHYAVALPAAVEPYRNLQLELSPELQLLPTSDDSIVEEIEYFPDQGSRATVRLDPSSPAPIEFSLRFRVRRKSAYGVVRLPTCRLSDAQDPRRLLAVTIDPQLQVRIASEDGMARVDEFQQRSGLDGPPQLPDVAYELVDPDPEWVVRVGPLGGPVAIRQRTLVTCAIDRASIVFEADWRDLTQAVWQHSAEAPRGFDLQRVTAESLETGGEIPVDWALDSSGRVNVFFRRPVGQPHSLRIEGVLSYREGRVPTPRIAFDRVPAATDELLLYRTGSTLVDWAEPQLAPSLIDDDASVGSANRRLIGRYRLPNSDSAISELKVWPNNAEYVGTTAAVVDFSREDGPAVVHVACDVRKGVVDRLRFSASSAWLEVASPDGSTIVNSLGSGFDRGRRVYEAILPRAYGEGESFQLQLSGSLVLESAPGTAAVDLQLEDAAQSRRYVALKTQGVRAPWKLQGLREAAPPESLLQALGGADQSFRFFRIVGRRFSVMRPDARRSTNGAFVSMAKMSAILNDDGVVSCRAEFTVNPGSASHCVIQPPRGAELLAVSTAGRFALAQPVNEQKWRLPLAPALLPQVVLVDYQYDGRKQRELRLAPPAVAVDSKQLALGKTMWIVRGGNEGLIASDQYARAVTQETFQEIVVDSHLADFSLSRTAFLQLPQWEADFWLTRWTTHIEESLTAMDSLLGESATLNRQWEELLASFSSERTKTPAVEEYAVPAVQADTNGGRAKYWYVDRADGVLRLTHEVDGPSWPLRLSAVCIVAVIGVVAWAKRFTIAPLLDLVSKNFLLAALVGGIFLAVVFRAPLLGALLVAATLPVVARSRFASSNVAELRSEGSRVFLQP